MGLVANQGPVKAWRFSHWRDSNCSGESVIHLAAKQALVELAGRSAGIFTPGGSGTSYGRDFTSQKIVAHWSVDAELFRMKSGVQERSLAAGLGPDVLLEGALDGSWLAVEIFVTNSKNEESRAKYAELRQDAIEIDLSGAPWNVDQDALQDRLLKGANRSWLYS